MHIVIKSMSSTPLGTYPKTADHVEADAGQDSGVVGQGYVAVVGPGVGIGTVIVAESDCYKIS